MVSYSLHSITKNYFQFNFNPSDQNGFLDLNLGDIANIVIAIITTILTFYVFFYQRAKDKEDKKNLVKQFKSASQIEMYKLLIIEPNVDELHDFFEKIKGTIHNLFNSNQVNRINIAQTSIDTDCNNFEEKFIELLRGIDSAFHNNILGVLDKFRDELSQEFANSNTNNQIDRVNFDALFFEFRSNFINGLYNFTNLDLD